MFSGGVQIREGGSKSASGYGPGSPNPLADMDRAVQIRGGSKSAVRQWSFVVSFNLFIFVYSMLVNCEKKRASQLGKPMENLWSIAFIEQ